LGHVDVGRRVQLQTELFLLGQLDELENLDGLLLREAWWYSSTKISSSSSSFCGGDSHGTSNGMS
jgi:hypothetical protein